MARVELYSEREIEMMRRPGLLVWEAHQLAASLIRPGETTGKIDAAVSRLLQEKGAEPLFLNVPHPDPGGPPFPAVTCMSVNEEVVHGIPSDRELKQGDILSIDMGCRIEGWCGDAAVTHPVGQIDQKVQKLLEVTEGTLKLAIELAGKLQRWSQVAAQMANYVRDHGFSVVEAFVGHGIGRQMHEPPQVPNCLSPQLRSGGDFQLEPGLVIAIEPMVNMGSKRVRGTADRWTQVTVDGLPSAHFEHTIAITRSGPRVLTGPPEEP